MIIIWKNSCLSMLQYLTIITDNLFCSVFCLLSYVIYLQVPLFLMYIS